jgi:hypothetical protein
MSQPGLQIERQHVEAVRGQALRRLLRRSRAQRR